MQKTLLLLSFVLFASLLSAQCDDLFFSEYVEGYANNKAMEIYNPTSSAINLSGYSIARFSNGSTTAGENKIIQLPDVMLASNDAFVVVVDLTDTTLWDSQFDKPAWNGYNVIDTIFDIVTGDPVLDADGNVLFGPQYLDGSALFGTEYNEQYDLQCKADIFLCPDYDTNNAMYFNGNDAMALITGTEIAVDGSNLVDVIGVIGEDPEDSIGEDAWVDADGFWVTKDRSLVRKPGVTTGRNTLTDVVAQSGGTFMGEEWLSYPKNSFQYLQTHNSTCNSTTQADEYSCANGPILSTTEFNEIPFSIYPNPTMGAVTIEAEEAINELSVFNLMGQQMFSQTIDNATGKVNLDLGHFTAGMYLINLTFDGNKLSIQKLIVE